MSEQQEVIFSNIVKIHTDYSPNCAIVEAYLTDDSVRIKRVSMTFVVAGNDQNNKLVTTIERRWDKNDKGIVLVRAILSPLQGDKRFTVSEIVAHLPKGKTALIKPPAGYTIPSRRKRIAAGIRNIFGCLKK